MRQHEAGARLVSSAFDSTAMNSTIKGRGSAARPEGRYIDRRHAAEGDGWFVDGEPAAAPQTTVTDERARSLLRRNQSPDLPFTQSVDAYRGCDQCFNGVANLRQIVGATRSFSTSLEQFALSTWCFRDRERRNVKLI
jgi:hypothetical protein